MNSIAVPFLKSFSSGVYQNALQGDCKNQLTPFLPGRIHEKLFEMLCKICRYTSIHTFSPHPGVIIERVGVGGEEVGLCHQTWLWQGRLLSEEALWET